MQTKCDYLPSEGELSHYEKCNDGVVDIATAKRLVRMIRELQKHLAAKDKL